MIDAYEQLKAERDDLALELGTMQIVMDSQDLRLVKFKALLESAHHALTWVEETAHVIIRDGDWIAMEFTARQASSVARDIAKEIGK